MQGHKINKAPELFFFLENNFENVSAVAIHGFRKQPVKIERVFIEAKDLKNKRKSDLQRTIKT